MKRILVILSCFLILCCVTYACDYEGVLCGSSGDGENASADTSEAESRNY